MTTNYTALDAAILQAIAQKSHTASSLQAELAPHIKTLLPSDDPRAVAAALWRTIDRRLQALRRRGFVRFDLAARGWQLENTKGAD